MLGKLLGYEMKAYGRIMVPIYIALIALSAVLGIGFHFLPDAMTHNFIFILLFILYILLLVSVGVMTTILGVNRYYGNLLGREGYFMFSLPTKTSTMMSAKTLAALIWTAFGAIAGFASILLTSFIAFNDDSFKEIVNAIIEVLPQIKPYLGNIIAWVIVVIFGVVTLIVRVYAAVSIGSQWSGHRMIGSILVYIGFKVIETVIASIVRAITPLREAIENTIGNGDPASFKPVILALAIILIELIIYWVIAWFFTDRKLNLE